MNCLFCTRIQVLLQSDVTNRLGRGRCVASGDWMKDPGLRSVSLEARGLWMDMLCLLFESGRRGYLQHATGKPVSPEQLARMTGSSAEQVSRLLRELEDSGVFSRTEHGRIYSRRMIRDERKRAACSEAGKKGGGNPGAIGLPLGVLTIINESRWADSFNPVLVGVFEGFALAAQRGARAIRDVVAYFSLASRHARKLRKIQQRIEVAAMEAFRCLEEAARLKIDEAGMEMLAKCNREIVEMMAREYRDFPVGVLREVLEKVRPAVITAATPRTSLAIADSVSDVVDRLCVNGVDVRHRGRENVSQEII